MKYQVLKRRLIPWSMAMGAGCVALFVARVARAGIVYYANPAEGEKGHFNWRWQENDDNQITFENWLDITRPSTDQFGLGSGSSVAQLAGGDGGVSQNFTFEGAAVAQPPGLRLTRAFDFGEDISLAEGDFDTISLHVLYGTDGIESEFEEGVLAYIGVKTEIGNDGWIAVIRGTEGQDRYNLSTTGWAYETIPGKPILAGQIPAPAAFAPLLLAPLVHCRRRNR